MGAHGRWRNSGVRFRAELRRSLPEGHPAHSIDFRSWRIRHETGDRRPVQAVISKLLTAESVEIPREIRNCSLCDLGVLGGKTLTSGFHI